VHANSYCFPVTGRPRTPAGHRRLRGLRTATPASHAVQFSHAIQSIRGRGGLRVHSTCRDANRHRDIDLGSGHKHITAAIAAYGFTPGSHHAIHLHPGTCRDQSQPPSVPFPDISADQGGAVNQIVESTNAAAAEYP